ncbi:cytochrome b pre-mRNA-processing protein 3, partial [Tremellales sp. Uapishka_1]
MSRRIALSLLRSAPRTSARAFTVTAASQNAAAKKPELSSAPIPISNPPVFPARKDPFDSKLPAPNDPSNYSDTTKNLVRGVAKLMGYNSKAVTAIRETGRMMRGIVEAVERDRSFWYDECALPPSYQSFFQLHLLYILLLLPRLRTLPATSSTSSLPAEAIPEPISSSTPSTTPEPSISTSTPILSKPLYATYPEELLTHFFEMAESEMRVVLGRGERESKVRKYMDEMGEQWKGAGVGLDYILALGMSEIAEERQRADAELASWVWRNLFASKGVQPIGLESAEKEMENETEFLDQLESVVKFVRKEMERLDRITDEEVLNGNIGQWGLVKE